MSTINSDVPINDASEVEKEFDPAEAFSKSWAKDAAKPPKAGDDETDDETKKVNDDETTDEAETTDADDEAEGTDEKSSDEGDGEAEEKGEDEANDDNVVVKDEYKVKVAVDGEDQEFSIGQLKRLAGQEAALTRKSQEVATKRKQLDTNAATHVAALNVLLERATKRWEPYSKINLLAAAKDPNISAEELTALQEAAQTASDDKRFLEHELGAFSEALRTQKHQELREQAAETVKVLSDPEKGIPNFNEKLYGEMVSFAKEVGVPEDAANEIVDPISFKILHMAMLYARGKKAVTESKPEKKKAPKKIVKSISNSDETKKAIKGAKNSDAMKRLRDEGTTDAAADAFAARWADSD